MSQYDFKPGERVRFIGSQRRLPHGSIGTVHKLPIDVAEISVAWDGFTDGHDGFTDDPSRNDFWLVFARELEPAL